MFKEACQLLLSSLSSGGNPSIAPKDSNTTHQLTHLKFTLKLLIFQAFRYKLTISPHLIPLAARDTL